MTRTIALTHALDNSGLPHPAPAATATGDDVGRYHHPKFLRAEPNPTGRINYYFNGFTGYEARPAMPDAVWDDKTITRAQRRELDWQYEAARVLWSKAHLRVKAGPVLRRAVPVWAAWKAAEAELGQVFGAFWNTPDGMWRAQLLRLTDAEKAAESAAAAWDKVAQELAELADEQLRAAGEMHDLPLTEVARDIGLDVSGWDICPRYDYTNRPWGEPTPLVAWLRGQVAAQRERLAEVARLAGETQPRSGAAQHLTA